MLMHFLVILVLAVVLTYVSLVFTQEKLGGKEADELGVGIAMILLGFFVFAVCGEDELLLPVRWAEESNLLYYLVRYGFLLVAVIGIVVSLVAIYKRTSRLEIEIRELQQREREARNNQEK